MSSNILITQFSIHSILLNIYMYKTGKVKMCT